MRIDYCPKCKKAGLKYESPEGLDFHGKTMQQRYVDYQLGIKSDYGTAKWCPRCKEWVKPENHEWSR